MKLYRIVEISDLSIKKLNEDLLDGVYIEFGYY